ncbi:unnamed protein product [Eruca vesicaria subsp. sativa]|uniref:Uncharacterized protein n=1 Tax=Eruca vesicaria subsp. sativa TaxID=29727 RepID=A0ABC8K982_ERUVS|nr:unnamed protein product [Eruca vesicaria subsp. sativa]
MVPSKSSSSSTCYLIKSRVFSLRYLSSSAYWCVIDSSWVNKFLFAYGFIVRIWGWDQISDESSFSLFEFWDSALLAYFRG